MLTILGSFMTKKSKYKELKQGCLLSNTLISRVFYKNKSIHIEFFCGCGNKQQSTIGNFIRKPHKVCNLCAAANVAKTKEKYAMKDRNLYQLWKAMNWRCHPDKGHEAYLRKNIKVHWEWSEDNPEGFNNFLRDMHPRPKGLTLDRIDNSKGYCKENCRWLDIKGQQNNRENNHEIFYADRTWTLQILSEHLGIKSNTLLYRLKRGWTVEEAVKGFRVKDYCRPYKNKLTDEEFYHLMYDLIVLGKSQTEVGNKYHLHPSNLSRVMRKPEALEYFNEERSRRENEPLGK